METLEYEADIAVSEMRQGRVGHLAAVGVGDHDAARSRLTEQTDDIEKCRLTAAARPHDRDKLARLTSRLTFSKAVVSISLVRNTLLI